MKRLNYIVLTIFVATMALSLQAASNQQAAAENSTQTIGQVAVAQLGDQISDAEAQQILKQYSTPVSVESMLRTLYGNDITDQETATIFCKKFASTMITAIPELEETKRIKEEEAALRAYGQAEENQLKHRQQKALPNAVAGAARQRPAVTPATPIAQAALISATITPTPMTPTVTAQPTIATPSSPPLQTALVKESQERSGPRPITAPAPAAVTPQSSSPRSMTATTIRTTKLFKQLLKIPMERVITAPTTTTTPVRHNNVQQQPPQPRLGFWLWNTPTRKLMLLAATGAGIYFAARNVDWRGLQKKITSMVYSR